MLLPYILYVAFVHADIISCENTDKTLVRNKRYLVYPEGSTFSIAICTTAQMGITPGSIFTEAWNWGITYELPNDTKIFKEDALKPKHLVQRRYRRDLYNKMEIIMNAMGYNGRSCIMRVLCETSQHLKPNGDSLAHEILRIIFSFPPETIAQTEHEDHKLYHWASRKGSLATGQECTELFYKCPFSLIDLALGYYSNHMQHGYI